MGLITDLIDPLKPRTPATPGVKSPTRYQRLWRFSIIITLAIAIIPLIVLTLVNYYQDRKTFRTENEYKITQIIENTKRTLEFVIEERRSALTMIVNEQSYYDLCSDELLGTSLRNLNISFGGFVDLGIIDSDGTQVNYAGPYELKGRNYKDQSWFHEVNLRGVYVSDVFMGFRNFPHFVIGVKHDKGANDYFVLRATLDMDLINQQIYSLDLDELTDAFIVNQEGTLQTSSKFYGKMLAPSGIGVPTHSRNSVVLGEIISDGEKFIHGYTYIKGTPFVLMASRMSKDPVTHWLSHREQLIWFLAVTLIIIIFVTVSRSTYMVKRLRASDERHEKALHNIEYTSKMATIGRMAASVAHEINNPLAIINEKAGLLKDMVTFSEDFPKKEKSLKLLTKVEESVERCSKVTHRLLGFSRRMDLKRELIDPGHLMREVAGFISKEAEHRNVSIDFHIDEDVPSIESDRGQLQQVFLNIVNNGVAAVSDGGKIDIYVRSAGGEHVAVTVSDNGKGISEEDLKHIFEPFFSTKGEFGTGLGLSITKDIIEKLGGKIEVQSVLKRGTNFTITLPVRQKN